MIGSYLGELALPKAASSPERAGFIANCRPTRSATAVKSVEFLTPYGFDHEALELTAQGGFFRLAQALKLFLDH